MQGRSSMLVTDVDVGDAGLQQPRQRLRVVGVGRQTDLPLNDARFQVGPGIEVVTATRKSIIRPICQSNPSIHKA